ncbi:chain amino acid ABC transporter substrate binding protein [Pandoraea communis]|uniref:Chain amino acid ABC transporter substrate binding protein n=1 Tax=Pandoraea communis TaxID=2508297 RepID=A0A5E4UV34_9BURK|nr:chain amino acid ABC transporter substrate binding protein [Pandoraea communis]
MKVGVAYIEEPLFYWTGSDNRATGADIELADVTLRAIGASDVEFVQTTFEELLAGVQEGRCSLCARRIDRHRGGAEAYPGAAHRVFRSVCNTGSDLQATYVRTDSTWQSAAMPRHASCPLLMPGRHHVAFAPRVICAGIAFLHRLPHSPVDQQQDGHRYGTDKPGHASHHVFSYLSFTIGV